MVISPPFLPTMEPGDTEETWLARAMSQGISFAPRTRTPFGSYPVSGYWTCPEITSTGKNALCIPDAGGNAADMIECARPTKGDHKPGMINGLPTSSNGLPKAMKMILILLLCIPQAALAKCAELPSQKMMASEIYKDEDFRRFACKGKECSENSFFDSLEFFPESLDKKGLHEGCLVGTNLNVQNQEWWFFLTDDFPSFQFSHRGRVDFSKKYWNGKKIINLIDPLDRTQYFQQRLAWTGKNYMVKGGQTLHTWP